jgi:hypothetical protein
VVTELEDDNEREYGGEGEPWPGSFDRMANQEKAWKQYGFHAVDAEQDDCDREDDDPKEAKQQLPEMTRCA